MIFSVWQPTILGLWFFSPCLLLYCRSKDFLTLAKPNKPWKNIKYCKEKILNTQLLFHFCNCHLSSMFNYFWNVTIWSLLCSLTVYWFGITTWAFTSVALGGRSFIAYYPSHKNTAPPPKKNQLKKTLKNLSTEMGSLIMVIRWAFRYEQYIAVLETFNAQKILSRKTEMVLLSCLIEDCVSYEKTVCLSE